MPFAYPASQLSAAALRLLVLQHMCCADTYQAACLRARRTLMTGFWRRYLLLAEAQMAPSRMPTTATRIIIAPLEDLPQAMQCSSIDGSRQSSLLCFASTRMAGIPAVPEGGPERAKGRRGRRSLPSPGNLLAGGACPDLEACVHRFPIRCVGIADRVSLTQGRKQSPAGLKPASQVRLRKATPRSNATRAASKTDSSAVAWH